MSHGGTAPRTTNVNDIIRKRHEGWHHCNGAVGDERLYSSVPDPMYADDTRCDVNILFEQIDRWMTLFPELRDVVLGLPVNEGWERLRKAVIEFGNA